MKSPLKPRIRVPTTSEGRVLKSISKDEINQGYDFDGLRVSWEDNEDLIFDGPEENESPLPFGPESSLPVDVIAEYITERSCTP